MRTILENFGNHAIFENEGPIPKAPLAVEDCKVECVVLNARVRPGRKRQVSAVGLQGRFAYPPCFPPLLGPGSTEDFFMDAESRIAIVSMIVEDTEMSAEINRILHEYRDWLVGRMGIPYKQQNVAVICVVVDAPANVTSSLSGKLGMLGGISTKTIYQSRKKET